MESAELSTITVLEILATSLVTRLTLDELEWLGSMLVEHAEEQRCKEAVEPHATHSAV
jgi:hypothetical protein